MICYSILIPVVISAAAVTARLHPALIVAFLALCSTNIFNSDTVFTVVLQVFMILFVNAIELVPLVSRIGEIYFGCAVTVNAPAHAQLCKLFYFIHFLYGTMAGLALYLAGA